MNEVFIRTCYNLPSTVKGFVHEDTDGNYTIFINDNLSDEAKRKTLAHEMNHIKKLHLQQRDLSVNDIEEDI